MCAKQWSRLRFFLTLSAVSQLVNPFLASEEGGFFLRKIHSAAIASGHRNCGTAVAG